MDPRKKPEFIVEAMPDLTTNEKENPIATKFRDEIIRYSNNNVVLENGQMIYIELSKDVQEKIFEYNMEIFSNILRSEKLLIECKKIIEDYKLTGNNNSASFRKNCYDIIMNMDLVNKYVWNICKLLNDGVDGYKDYLEWQKDKINLDTNIYERWSIIYNIRNEIEHPSHSLSPTFLKKSNENIMLPTITYNNQKYDMLGLAMNSIEIAFIFARLVIGASFLYSKYTLTVTDENRTNLFIVKKEENNE